MARKKRSRKRSRGNTFEAVGSSRQLGGAKWGDLEQAFFEAAPPDEPAPPPEALRFDDLESAAPPERVTPRLMRFMAGLLSARSSRRRVVAIALASMCLLICLSAFAVVLRSVTRPRSTVEPAAPASNSGARGRGDERERERGARVPARS